MKLIDNSIEWLVAIAVMMISTFGMLDSLGDVIDNAFFSTFINYIKIFPIFFVFLYQLNHYGLKVYHKGFMIFFLIYCLYILFDLTINRKLPLNELKHAPTTVVAYLYSFVLSLLYLFSAKTVVQHLNVGKYMLLSILFCTIPSLLLIQFVGVDLIQMGLSEGDEGFISTLGISYANLPLGVMGFIYFKSLLKSQSLSVFVSFSLIIVSVFIILVYAKRGPLLWMVLAVLVCYLIHTRKIKKYIFMVAMLVIMMVLFTNPIISLLKNFFPNTGERIEMSIKEGDTDARFDIQNANESTYLIGLENFSRSPVWGNYFRLETNFLYFRGHYPHNNVIEILITMGLVGFVPFVLLLYRAFRISRTVLVRKYTSTKMLCFILFVCPFLQTLTSETIVFKLNFWFFLYILCCLDNLSSSLIPVSKKMKVLNN